MIIIISFNERSLLYFLRGFFDDQRKDWLQSCGF